MAVNAKIIRRRVKSVSSTKKITKAMELVAAAKMRKAVKSALASRAYARLAREMMNKLAQMKQISFHPLMKVWPVQKILLILISSNRGLCGGFNANIYRKTLEQIKNLEPLAVQRSFGQKIKPGRSADKIQVEAITIGKKSEKIMRQLGIKIIASFHNLSDTPTIFEAQPIAKIAREEFINKNFQKVAIIYTDYLSAISQRPTIRQVLPISPVDLEKMLRILGGQEKEIVDPEENPIEFFFEPNPKRVLEEILPRLMELQIYQAMLESSASEHSARMMAMRNASNAAEDMIDDLVFTLNQARQANITREIAEISGGVAALE